MFESIFLIVIAAGFRAGAEVFNREFDDYLKHIDSESDDDYDDGFNKYRIK